MAPARATRYVPAWWYAAKRCIDVAGAAAVLVLSAPVVLLSALAIMLVSPGSPFFAQERVGQNGRLFRLFKLRTMVDGAHLVHEDMRAMSDVSGPVFKMRNDPRLHALGGLLRRASIDELPNLFNVLLGEMSLVGPRPPLPSEVEHYDAFAMRRSHGEAGHHVPVASRWAFQRRFRGLDAARQRVRRYVDAVGRRGVGAAHDTRGDPWRGRALGRGSASSSGYPPSGRSRPRRSS